MTLPDHDGRRTTPAQSRGSSWTFTNCTGVSGCTARASCSWPTSARRRPARSGNWPITSAWRRLRLMPPRSMRSRCRMISGAPWPILSGNALAAGRRGNRLLASTFWTTDRGSRPALAFGEIGGAVQAAVRAAAVAVGFGVRAQDVSSWFGVPCGLGWRRSSRYDDGGFAYGRAGRSLALVEHVWGQLPFIAPSVGEAIALRMLVPERTRFDGFHRRQPIGRRRRTAGCHRRFLVVPSRQGILRCW